MILFVPPVVAPLMKAEIMTRAQQERQCAWSPFCGCLAAECNGWTRAGCKQFGRNGLESPPSLAALEEARLSNGAATSAAAQSKK